MIQEYILGGYTKRKNDGIYAIQFDDETIKFDNKNLIANLSQPTFLTLSKDGRFLFAIHKDKQYSGLVAFKKIDNQWKEIARLFDSEIPGCHISYRESSQTIYISNYHLGKVDIYQLQEQSQLVHLQTIQHEGSSVHPNQNKPHVHFADLGSDEQTLYVCDLGTDELSAYDVDDSGQLTLQQALRLPAGTGPRHLVIHSTQPYMYVVGELNSTTNLIKILPDGQLEYVESFTNIPEEKVETSAGSAIRLTQDGQFLYVSSRFYNVITVYKVDVETGQLEKIQTIDSVGQIPRDFIIDESDSFLLIPHQDSDHITIMKRNPETGLLKFIDNDTKAPECVCIIHG